MEYCQLGSRASIRMLSPSRRADFSSLPRRLSCGMVRKSVTICIYSSRVGILLTILKPSLHRYTPLVTAHARNNLRSSRYCHHCHSSRHDRRPHLRHRRDTRARVPFKSNFSLIARESKKEVGSDTRLLAFIIINIIIVV